MANTKQDKEDIKHVAEEDMKLDEDFTSDTEEDQDDEFFNCNDEYMGF